MTATPHTCCFTGHRKIANAELPFLQEYLGTTIETLIRQGVYSFACGGAIGFDMLAGFTVLDFKQKYSSAKLIMVLPCRNQESRWPQKEKTAYRNLVCAADKVIYVSEQYFAGCMEKRNTYLVENSDYCIAYLKYARSGTSQTVRLAKERRLTVINLADG